MPGWTPRRPGGSGPRVTETAPSRVLITGATGFVGGALARRLVRDGAEVHALVRRPVSDPAVVGLSATGVHAHHHDGTVATMKAIVASAAPEVVFHLATNFVGTHTEADVRCREAIRLDEDTDLKSAGPKGFGGSSPSASALFVCASVAQLVEFWSPKPAVGSSNP